MIHPIPETEASDSISTIYKDLKESLGVHSVPVFFTYMATFPDYLAYISKQLRTNITDPAFIRLSGTTGNEIKSLIASEIPRERSVANWHSKYGASSGFYHFTNQIQDIYGINIKLAFVFLALREAIKGWAVAAKRLDGHHEIHQEVKDAELPAEDFIYGAVDEPSVIKKAVNAKPSKKKSASSASLTKSEKKELEESLLPKYLELCRTGFSNQMETAEFWQLRVAIEKLILAVLPLMPHVVFSPINVVIDLTKKHEQFPDLLHLLSEQFPTYAVQRMMFSGYILRDSADNEQ